MRSCKQSWAVIASYRSVTGARRRTSRRRRPTSKWHGKAVEGVTGAMARLVMLDGEDAQALRDDVTEQGLRGATELLVGADWRGDLGLPAITSEHPLADWARPRNREDLIT